MHKFLPLLLFLELGFRPLPAQITNSAPAPDATPPPLFTAVLNFQTSDDSQAKQGAEIATLLEADLTSATHTLLVERQDVDKVLSEQELGLSGLVSTDSAAKVGALTGAQVLVTGRYFEVGNQSIIVAKIISAETSRVYGVTATVSDPSNLASSVQDLSGKIDGVLAAHRDVLVEPQETDEQRWQRLRPLVPPAPLPTVAVSIPERDYTQATIDPAAQTEIMKDLQQLGFQVIDTAKHGKPDIMISGEAFSELGARRDNLVSSLGRVEINVTRASSRVVLWTDRETRVAVDVGDHTAGKEALQKAARILFERLLPKLTK